MGISYKLADTKWDEFKYWMYHTGKNEAITTIVNMHQFGYEVEKEARYAVSIKGIKVDKGFLNYDKFSNTCLLKTTILESIDSEQSTPAKS